MRKALAQTLSGKRVVIPIALLAAIAVFATLGTHFRATEARAATMNDYAVILTTSAAPARVQVAIDISYILTAADGSQDMTTGIGSSHQPVGILSATYNCVGAPSCQPIPGVAGVNYFTYKIGYVDPGGIRHETFSSPTSHATIAGTMGSVHRIVGGFVGFNLATASFADPLHQANANGTSARIEPDNWGLFTSDVLSGFGVSIAPLTGTTHAPQPVQRSIYGGLGLSNLANTGSQPVGFNTLIGISGTAEKVFLAPADRPVQAITTGFTGQDDITVNRWITSDDWAMFAGGHDGKLGSLSLVNSDGTSQIFTGNPPAATRTSDNTITCGSSSGACASRALGTGSATSVFGASYGKGVSIGLAGASQISDLAGSTADFGTGISGKDVSKPTLSDLNAVAYPDFTGKHPPLTSNVANNVLDLGTSFCSSSVGTCGTTASTMSLDKRWIGLLGTTSEHALNQVNPDKGWINGLNGIKYSQTTSATLDNVLSRTQLAASSTYPNVGANGTSPAASSTATASDDKGNSTAWLFAVLGLGAVALGVGGVTVARRSR